MPPQAALHLPWGFRDAKRWLLAQAIVGEFFQGTLLLCVIWPFVSRAALTV